MQHVFNTDSDSASVSFGSVMRTYEDDVNSTSGENWRELSPLTISTEALFNNDSYEETLNVNKSCWQY